MNKRQRKKLERNKQRVAVDMKPPEAKWAGRQLQSPELHGKQRDDAGVPKGYRLTKYYPGLPIRSLPGCAGLAVAIYEPEEKPKLAEAAPETGEMKKTHMGFMERVAMAGIMVAVAAAVIMWAAAAYKFTSDIEKTRPEEVRQFLWRGGLK